MLPANKIEHQVISSRRVWSAAVAAPGTDSIVPGAAASVCRLAWVLVATEDCRQLRNTMDRLALPMACTNIVMPARITSAVRIVCGTGIPVPQVPL